MVYLYDACDQISGQDDSYIPPQTLFAGGIITLSTTFIMSIVPLFQLSVPSLFFPLLHSSVVVLTSVYGLLPPQYSCI